MRATVDMFRAMQTYKEVGFNGPFMMDHTPSIPDDAGGRQGPRLRHRLHPRHDPSRLSLT